MKVLHIIGVDLSKNYFDVALHQGEACRLDNTSKGFTALLKWFQLQKLAAAQVLMVMEHTGRYSYQLEAFLHHKHVGFVKVPALEIQRSLGMQRGKTDALDARRIARYGYEKRDQLQPATLRSETLQRLQLLYSTRRELVEDRSRKMAQKKSLQATGLLQTDSMLVTCTVVMKLLTRQIVKLEKEISTLIAGEAALQRNYELLQSETAVGPVVALAIIIKTDNFTKFANGRKFSCYCGNAPFEHQSGTSIRGRTRVSHLADKDMKSKLHQAAKCAIQHDPELSAYYQRKVAEGKARMSVLNVVSNKMIHRMFAIIKRQTPYEIRIPAAA